MKSKWSEYKAKAIALRKRGNSIRTIEISLGISRSTLSGWFKDVPLSLQQQKQLRSNWRSGLAQARKKAVLWHNRQKEARILLAESQAKETIAALTPQSAPILDLALSILYLGEGYKSSPNTALGNSDPLILRFFIAVLRKNYKVPISAIRCELHLRYDQDPQRIKRYWSKALAVPLKNFTSVSIDKRTKNSLSYPSYHGVCVVRCGRADVQRKLLALSRQFCEKVIRSTWAYSSVG
jgi:hypothetical protein